MAMLLCCIREVRGSNPDGDTDSPDWGIRDFPQALQTNDGIVQ
jgi:hypothetical protein